MSDRIRPILPLPIRWAVVGLGRFGVIHARVLDQLADCELVAASNRNQARLAEASVEFGHLNLTADFHEILADETISAISITTHWKDHFEVAKAALEAGKHVFLEKPMASSSAECHLLLQIAEDTPGSLMVGHICRFDPRVTLAKEAIDAGQIGRIVSMHARRNLPKAPGHIRLDKISPLIGDGIHDADLMMWFMDRSPSEIYGRQVKVGDYRYPDLGWAMLHFGADAIGVVETVWCLPENTPTTIDARMEVIGTEGKLSIEGGLTGLTITDAEGTRMPDTVYWPREHGEQIGALRRELEYFNRCLQHGVTPDRITPREAARALAAMETAEESSRQGVPIPFSF